jgi:hypothetical protein
MSTVTLSAFAVYKQNGTKLKLIAGASESVVTANNKRVLRVGSVPFAKPSFAKMAPKVNEGLLMLYGSHDQMDELQRQHALTRELGTVMAHARFEFEVGAIEVGLTDCRMLNMSGGKNRFLNVRRMKRELQHHVLGRMAEYVHEEGGNSDRTMFEVVQMAKRPDLFARVLNDDPGMSQLDMLVIPVADGEDGQVRQLALVRPSARLISVRQFGEVELVLPEWMDSPRPVRLHRGPNCAGLGPARRR